MKTFFRRIAPFVIAAILPFAFIAGCAEPTPAEHVVTAKKLIDEGNLESASIELSNALQQDPNLLEARWLLGKVSLDLGDGPKAEKEIRRAIDLGYAHESAQLALVRAVALQDEPARVITETESVDPAVPPADRATMLGLRAQALASRGKFDQAEVAARQALDVDPKSALGMAGMSLIHALQRDFDGARQWVNRALQADPHSADAWSLLGQIELEQGHAAEAEQALSRGIELRKGPSIEYAKRALARAQLDKFDEAANDLEVLRRAGLESNVYVSYVAGVNFFRQKKYEEAAQALEASKEDSAPYLPREYYLASTYLALGRIEQARSQAELINSIAPRSPAAKRLLGAVQISQSELEAATDVLNKAVQSSPGDAVMLRMLGYVALLLGNTADAVQYYQRALTLDPDAVEVRDALELARLMDGQKLDQQTAGALGDAAVGADSFTREFLQALALFRDGNLPEALKQARALSAKYPDNVEPIKLMAACYLAARQWEQAKQYLDQVLDKKPNEPSAVKNLARLEMLDGQLDEARGLLEGLIKAVPTDAEAYVLLARVHERVDGPALATQGLEQALERNPDALTIRAELARLYASTGRQERVIELTRVLKDKDFVRDPSLLERQAKAQLATGDVDGAQRGFSQLVELSPKSAAAHFAYSESLVRGGKKVEAAAELERAIELDAAYLPARVGQIKLKVLDNDLDGARKRLEALRKDFGNSRNVLDVEAWFALGTADYATAAARYSELLESNPNSELVILYVRAMWGQRKYDEAITRMEAWLKNHPKDLVVNMQLATSYVERGREADARTVYARVVELYPENVLALNNLAWLGREHNRSQSIAYAEKALGLAPSNPTVMDTLGMLLLADGNKDRGQRLIEQAAGLAPNDLDIQLHYAEVLADRGQAAGAKTLLQSIVEQAGDTPVGAAARSTLDRLP